MPCRSIFSTSFSATGRWLTGRRLGRCRIGLVLSVLIANTSANSRRSEASSSFWIWSRHSELRANRSTRWQGTLASDLLLALAAYYSCCQARIYSRRVGPLHQSAHTRRLLCLYRRCAAYPLDSASAAVRLLSLYSPDSLPQAVGSSSWTAAGRS